MNTFLALKSLHLLGVVRFLGNIIVTAVWKEAADRMMAPAFGGVPGTPWLSLGMALFTASGVIWVLVLIPVQIAQSRLARGFASGGEIPARYWKLSRVWIGFGLLATILPLANLYLMVAKPGAV